MNIMLWHGIGWYTLKNNLWSSVDDDTLLTSAFTGKSVQELLAPCEPAEVEWFDHIPDPGEYEIEDVRYI